MASMEPSFVFQVFLSVCIVNISFATHVHEFEISSELLAKTVEYRTATRNKRDLSDSTCQRQEANFLKEVTAGNVKLEQKHSFVNESYYSLALAWCGNNGDLLVVITQENYGVVSPSKIYRSADYGATFNDVMGAFSSPPRIFRHNGVFRNPHNTRKVYLVDGGDKDRSHLYITEDGGVNFFKTQLPFQLTGDIEFYPRKSNENFLLASSAILSTKINSDHGKLMTLYASFDNGRSWKQVASYVQNYKWGTIEDKPMTIYVTVDPERTHPFLASFVPVQYVLQKCVFNQAGAMQSCSKILDKVISFGHQDKFLYASVYSQDVRGNRLMRISTDLGQTWNTAQLPTITSDRFYSVLDMNEKLVFMHVDNPGDTGHGTLYTSGAQGVVYSESLPKHLYPNYGEVTDFYRVESMRGVYITSQILEDNSIRSMITYNRGATWQTLGRPKGAMCKDEQKACNLQIHGSYSIQRGVSASPPLSTKSAPGLMLVHGHVADALQTTQPDVFVTSDGGYTWTKALDGPHQYQIADSGALLVAISTATPQPTTIKFSVDEGQCWHEYKFIKNPEESIILTGLLTEPENRALTMGVWGYHPQNKTWTVFVIDFAKVLTKQCGSDDYEVWKPHNTLRSQEEQDVKGCLLGMREEFKRVKKDKWCSNGYNYTIQRTTTKCICTREDYECDYGFFRKANSDLCEKISDFKKPDIDVCLRGHEEEIITQGYRKIPGDACQGGFSPKGRRIDLSKQCSENSKQLVLEEESFGEQKSSHGNASVVAAIVIIVVLLVIIMSVVLVHKYIILRRHRVVYRYSMLNQTDAERYDSEFERAMAATSGTVYHDSEDDEELNSPAVKKDTKTFGSVSTHNSTTMGTRNSSRDTQVKSYHDDSDVDMLE